jgi:hypothetical protein
MKTSSTLIELANKTFIVLMKRHIKRVIATKSKRWSVMITLLFSLIIVTPFCGFLFQCGCNWPWLGLDAGCNFYQPNSVHRCPWCASMIAGIFSTSLAIITSIWATTTPLTTTYQQPIIEITIRTISGVMVFVIIAILTAGFSALWQGYPLGVGYYLS